MPAEWQDALARFLLHELDEDERWEHSTAANADKLGALIDQVSAADKNGTCEPLNPDQL